MGSNPELVEVDTTPIDLSCKIVGLEESRKLYYSDLKRLEQKADDGREALHSDRAAFTKAKQGERMCCLLA